MTRVQPAALIAVAAFVPGVSAAQIEDLANDVIVVSDERRPTPVAESPLSIAAFDAAALDRIGADHPSEILNRAPGVLIHRGSGQEHLTSIRSPILTGGAGAGSFLFLENGVPLRAAGFANVNGLFEAHTEVAGSIEVVRGPAGALYGANAIHGVVNVLSRAVDAPSFVETSVDTIGRIKGRAFVSGDVGDQAFSLAASVLDDPGFRAESGVDQQKLSLQHRARAGRVTVSTLIVATNLNQETAGFIRGEDAFRDAALRRSNPDPEAFRDGKAVRASSRIDVDLGDGASLSVTPYGRWNDLEFSQFFLPSEALEDTGHWSLGAQSAFYKDGAASGRLDLVAGVDWEVTEGFLKQVQTRPDVGSFPQGVQYDYDVDAVQLAGFAQARLRLTPRLSARAAVRVDHTRYDYRNQTDDGVFGRFLRPPSRADRFTTASPKASLHYALGPGTAYASYARGARPPQTTDLYRLQINQTEDGADPEFIDAVEVGWRGAVGPYVRLDLAAYFMDKRNFFFRDADGFNVDDGKTRHIGGEVGLAARLPGGFRFDGSAAYARQTYRFARPVGSTANASEAIAFGDDVDSAPRWLSNARAGWSSPAERFDVEAEWARVGRYFTDASNARVYPGHDVINLRGEWAATRSLTVALTLRNVFNTFYAERADFAFGSDRFFPGEGRVATLRLRIDG
ncbi:MAG: TonB-dependent receptor [Pseudomonadota bacterium]